MRSDMAKVIVERPRVGSRARGNARKQGKNLALDDLPRRQGMKRLWRGGSKSFNEHLGPLARYLDSQVGRPWNKVFSEICAHINRNSVVQDHVRDHVDDLVVRNVLRRDGVPCSAEGRGYGTPLVASRYHHRFYVCPRTGLLRRVPWGQSQHARQQRQEQKLAASPRYNLSKSLQCRRAADGSCVLCTLKPIPANPWLSPDRDVLLDRPICHIFPQVLVKIYGNEVYAAAVRPVSRRELRALPVPVDLFKKHG
jgi:hypothetical protein